MDYNIFKKVYSKLHTGKPGIEPITSELWVGRANHSTNMSPSSNSTYSNNFS